MKFNRDFLTSGTGQLILVSTVLLIGVFAVRFLPGSTSLLLIAFGVAAGVTGGLLAVRRKNLVG